MSDLLDDDALLDLRRRGAKTDPKTVIAEERQRSPTTAAANQDLLEFGREGPAPTAPENVCPMCKIRPARQVCNACRKRVCSADIWTMLGLCKVCAGAEDVARWHKPAEPEPTNWLLRGKP